MKKICLFVFLSEIFMSCSKDNDRNSNGESSVFEAKVNGIDTKFDIESASLIHSKNYDRKRMDITVASMDKKTKLILTLTQTPAQGRGMSLKNYPIRFGLSDDPLTTELDESIALIDGQLMLGEQKDNGYALFPHPQKGNVIVLSCDEIVSVISGSFECSLLKQGDEIMNITEGKFSNIRYLFLHE
ncbi:hypothetical protein [Pollutibacter soli]|uniref:hypothetical protein n=1 Tax=Pollutibacter soli TaxID=3034157 RepID=UPI003013548F